MHIEKYILLLSIFLVVSCSKEENPGDYVLIGKWKHTNGSLTRTIEFDYPSFKETYTNTGIEPVINNGTYEKNDNTLFLNYGGIIDQNIYEYGYRIDKDKLILTKNDENNNNLPIHTSFKRQ